MVDEARRIAYRIKRDQQRIYQRWLDTKLTPASEMPAALVRQQWEPIEQLLEEGPHVGERQDPDNGDPQRIN